MRTYQLILPLIASAGLVSGCAGGEDTDNAPGGGGTSTSIRDACELLTAEEVAALHGGPVEVRREENGPHRSSCIFAVRGGEWDVMWLTVHWRGGKEEWDVQQAGRGIGAKMLSSERANVDSIVAPDPLAGIGDAAYYGGILPSLVIKGDVLLEFMMPLLKDDRLHFPALAQKAVSRL